MQRYLVYALGYRQDRVLTALDSSDKEGAGGWGYEWAKEGDRHVAAGKPKDALQFYNLARFPYPANSDMKAAHRKCVDTFVASAKLPGIGFERLSLHVEGNEVPFYFSRSGASNPLLLVMGGIVSIKEQWQAFLWAGKKLGMSVLVAEMPGVGENTLVYDDSAYAFLSMLIDAVRNKADVFHTHVVAMSFSGNLALRRAPHDSRIRAITTVGAPVRHFFTDAVWWRQVPMTTKRTLAHLCRVPENEVFDYIGRFAIADDELAELDIPVYYVRSLFDEIIPPSEKDVLVHGVARLNLREYRDFHGSPKHMSDMQTYVPMTVLKEAGTRRAAYNMLKLKLAVNAVKRRFGGASE
ncbi:MAG: alpha/beta hydrolase [Gammaproteobacteria bacterium]